MHELEIRARNDRRKGILILPVIICVLVAAAMLFGACRRDAQPVESDQSTRVERQTERPARPAAASAQQEGSQQQSEAVQQQEQQAVSSHQEADQQQQRAQQEAMQQQEEVEYRQQAAQQQAQQAAVEYQESEQEQEAMEQEQQASADSSRARSRQQQQQSSETRQTPRRALPGATNFEDYPTIGWRETVDDDTSTFSLDVDSTSYFLALNWVEAGYAIEPASVRAEEWINAFNYDYDLPEVDDSFAVTTDILEHPLHDDLHLVRIATQAPEFVDNTPLNVTLVLDASGSMQEGNVSRSPARRQNRSAADSARTTVLQSCSSPTTSSPASLISVPTIATSGESSTASGPPVRPTFRPGSTSASDSPTKSAASDRTLTTT